MQVILIESVDKLGKVGETVNVADGFGRNFLIPRKKAIRATKDNIAYFENQRASIEADNLRKKQTAEELAKELRGVSVVVVRQAAEDGRLYGSVSSRDIINGIKEVSGVELSNDQIVINTKFKEIGVYEITLNLHADVKSKAMLSIARTEQEGKASLEASSTPAPAVANE